MINNKSGIIILVTISLLWVGLLKAQESINSSGNDAIGGGGFVAYTVGQVVYTTNMGNSGSVAQGVQHAYEIFIEGISTTTLEISLAVFPNPALDNLTLMLSDHENNKLTYQLYDMQGRLIISEHIIAKQTQINTASLLTATYFIYLFNEENKKVKSFKFIKTK